ncbi:MAG: hypothetical protein HFE76_09270 [Firmicutes bacterium]|nr:hypothetical protein [Bacillota bacterium]
MENQISFELFKSNVCHRVKELGDLDFFIQTLKAEAIPGFMRFNIVERDIRNVV